MCGILILLVTSSILLNPPALELNLTNSHIATQRAGRSYVSFSFCCAFPRQRVFGCLPPTISRTCCSSSQQVGRAQNVIVRNPTPWSLHANRWESLGLIGLTVSSSSPRTRKRTSPVPGSKLSGSAQRCVEIEHFHFWRVTRYAKVWHLVPVPRNHTVSKPTGF